MGWVAFLAVIIIAIGGNFVCASMASDHRAVQAVENIGLRNVRVVDKGPSWGVFGGCKESDVAKFKVQGTDSYGKQRTIEVCAPVPFGGYTIRN
jgi:hypothetical protein